MTKIKEFDNLELMQTVRNMHLNPIIRKVENEISPDVDKLKDEMQHTFLDVNLDIATKTLKFDRPPGSGFKNIELAPIMPTFSGVGVEDDKGTGPGSGISLIKLKDATVTQTGNAANVSYDWPKIISDNTKDLGVGTIADGTRPTKFLFFKGADVVYTAGGAATVAIPTPASQIRASIPGKGQTTPEAITEIELEGESTSSVLSNGKLTIHLNAGGGGVAPASNDNFKGFFETLGDLESEIKDPINGKSYAFVRDQQLGGKYYTPHFFVSNSWAELKQDPALTYSGPKDPTTHGVFSIKPSDRILVDENGQLNLDGLSTPQDPQYFHGFFNSIAELKAAVTNPVPNKSLAYVKHANGAWIGTQWKMFGSSYDWRVMAPIGALSMVDDKTSSTVPAPFYGIYRNDQWELDTNGIATLKAVNTKTKSEIVDWEGNVSTGEFDTIQFRSGKSYINLNKNKLFVDHPQQIVQYDSEFESDHNTKDYEGNIFYDENSRTWMGWGIPKASGGVDTKWTRIAHPKMSDEVKDLTRRLPAKAPSVLPGILNDANEWRYNGVTYLEKDSDQLPEGVRDIYGAYVTTSVQDKDAAGITIPQYRIQTLTVDSDAGGSYVRRWVANGTPGASVDWSKWVKTSFSNKDIEKHSKDPNAHKDIIKAYKAVSFTAMYSTFYNQIEGGSPGGLRAENCSMFADNYGHFKEDHDYIESPYDGRFRVRGVLSISGYKESGKVFPVGAWKVLVRIKKKGTSEWRQVGHYIYAHADDKVKYPLMSFETNSTEVVRGDQIIINITFDNNNGLNREHPGLYFAPIRSYFVLEDEHTRVGTRIARTFSKYVGTVDVVGDVGVRVHHSDLSNPKSAIRVYGDVVSHTPTTMKPSP